MSNSTLKKSRLLRYQQCLRVNPDFSLITLQLCFLAKVFQLLIRYKHFLQLLIQNPFYIIINSDVSSIWCSLMKILSSRNIINFLQQVLVTDFILWNKMLTWLASFLFRRLSLQSFSNLKIQKIPFAFIRKTHLT